MDIQRSILLVALAVVAYMILLQWNNDYHKIPEESTHITQQQAEQHINTPAGTKDDNGDSSIHQPAPSDNITATNNSSITDTATTTPVSTNQQLISVETDVFKLKIDPHGGDIIQLDLIQYPKALATPNIPFRLFSNTGEVYYTAESRVLSSNNSTIPFYQTDKQSYKLEAGQKELKVNLSYSKDNVTYVKTFTFLRGLDETCAAKKKNRVSCINPLAYRINIDYKITNNSEKPWQGYFLASLIRNNAKDPSSSTATSMTTFLGMAYWTPDKPYTRIAMKDVDSIMRVALQNKAEQNLNYLPLPSATVKGGWIAWLQHYFVTAWVGNKNDNHVVKTYKDQQNNYIVSFTTPLVTVQAGQQTQENLTLYAGPKLQDSLKELSPGLDLTIDYGILSVIGKPIFWLLQLIHSALGNWGWSIIVLTIIVKLIFFPLSATSYKSMARMRAASPKMQSIRERYGDDRQKMSEAMMKLYKEEKLNPLSGCLPIIIQMPVFIALYWVLLESVEIRQAPWLGWIHDLSVSDPYLILPIIMGATMFLQQRLNPTPPDPIQAKVFKIMPIIFTFFFIWFPAGLVLYWVINNVLSIAQQWIITRQIEAAKKK